MCTECGSRLPPDPRAVFCDVCGSRIKVKVTLAPVKPAIYALSVLLWVAAVVGGTYMYSNSANESGWLMFACLLGLAGLLILKAEKRSSK
jgi:DNA-directed RNA polymerase subunit RPC12/RpoP